MNIERVVAKTIADCWLKINSCIGQSLLPISVESIEIVISPYPAFIFKIPQLSEYFPNELTHLRDALDIAFKDTEYIFSIGQNFITLQDCIPF